LTALSDEACEQDFLDRQSYVVNKDKETTKGLFPCTNFLLQVHGRIQQEKVIIFINPSSKHNVNNVGLAKRLQVPTKHIQSTQVEGENVQIFKICRLLWINVFCIMIFML
jgi:hypothetical protein